LLLRGRSAGIQRKGEANDPCRYCHY
jgi:hypothetical protein